VTIGENVPPLPLLQYCLEYIPWEKMKISGLVLTALFACLTSTAAQATVYTGYMSADQHLLPGDSLVSTDGQSKLVMKADGSIARTGPSGEFWNPGKFGQELVFQLDGNLVLYDLGRKNAVWSVSRGIFAPNSSYRLEISTTGALTAALDDVASPRRTVLWEVPGLTVITPTIPPTGPCGDGRPYLSYEVCIPTGGGRGMYGTVQACSQSEAASRARYNGWTLGACSF
jgi:hypothetical protein